MFRSLFEWYLEQSPLLRYGVVIALYAAAAVGYFGFHRIWWWPIAAGTAFLVFAGPSDSEKHGYRF